MQEGSDNDTNISCEEDWNEDYVKEEILMGQVVFLVPSPLPLEQP